MDRNPPLTVLCSSYNSSRWIDGYLDAINNQTLGGLGFDIIFVDAASTDASITTIEQFQFRPGINKKIIKSTERISIYEAWNLAILASSTAYVININTDDRLYPGGLATYLSYAAAHPNGDVFYGACDVVKDPNHRHISALYKWPNHSHETLLKRCICGPFPLLKRQSIIEDGLFDPAYTISGDYEMWLRMSKNNRHFINVRDTVGSYYLNPEGVSTNKETTHWQEHVRQDTAIRKKYAC